MKGKMKAMCLRYLNLCTHGQCFICKNSENRQQLRHKCVRNISLERFVEVLEDHNTGLTYPIEHLAKKSLANE